jgi:polar amino acid transport system ATP-binding protein
MSFARSVANEIIFMEHGKVQEHGSPDDLMKSPAFTRTREFIGSFQDIEEE